MLMTEEKLAVEIAQVDCVQVDDVDLAKPTHHKVLEEFASYPTGTNQQRPGLSWLAYYIGLKWD